MEIKSLAQACLRYATFGGLVLVTKLAFAEDQPSTVNLFEFNDICLAVEYPDSESQKKSQSKGYPLTLSVYPNKDIGDRPKAITENLRSKGIRAECVIGKYASNSGVTEYGFYLKGEPIRGKDKEIYHTFEEIMGNQEFRGEIKMRAVIAQEGR